MSNLNLHFYSECVCPTCLLLSTRQAFWKCRHFSPSSTSPTVHLIWTFDVFMAFLLLHVSALCIKDRLDLIWEKEVKLSGDFNCSYYEKIGFNEHIVEDMSQIAIDVSCCTVFFQWLVGQSVITCVLVVNFLHEYLISWVVPSVRCFFITNLNR